MKHLLVIVMGLALGVSCDDGFTACMHLCGQRGVAEYRYPQTSGDSCKGFKTNPGVCLCGPAPPDGGGR